MCTLVSFRARPVSESDRLRRGHEVPRAGRSSPEGGKGWLRSQRPF